MKTALVTGASSGIGKEFAYQLAERGYNLILVARRADLLLAIKKDLSQKFSAEVHVLPHDLLLESHLRALVDEVKECDLLVNCAGFGFMGDFCESDIGKEQDMIALNIKALHFLTKTLGERMAKKGSGGIINVASIAAFQPVPYFSAYAGTKAFVLSYSLGISQELKKQGIHVMVLCPGFASTEFYTQEEINDLKKKTMNLPLFMSPEIIVRKGLKAFFNKNNYYIPGFFNRLVVYINEFTPRVIAMPLTATIFKFLKSTNTRKL